jgi:hypothetical protein
MQESNEVVIEASTKKRKPPPKYSENEALRRAQKNISKIIKKRDYNIHEKLIENGEKQRTVRLF